MLYDSPPHRCSLYASTATNDAGGGVQITYSLVQSAVVCLINTMSANMQLQFAAQQIEVTHTIGIRSDFLTVTPKRGWKAVADDTGHSYEIVGIRSGRVSAMGTIPPLTYLDCKQLLE